MTVGQRIKSKREELGLSQSDLAKKMGVSRQAISKAELHDNNITTDKVVKFARALGVTEKYLMGWETKTEFVAKDIVLENNIVIENVESNTEVNRYKSIVNIFDAFRSMDKTSQDALFELISEEMNKNKGDNV